MTDTEFRRDVRSALRADLRPWRRRRMRWLLTVCVLAAAVLLTGTVYARRACATWTLHGMFDGISRTGVFGECVGSTDGHYPFDDENLGALMKLVAAENAAIRGEPSVTVAFYMPMTVGQGDVRTRNSIRRALLGAYLGQWHANHTGIVGTTPKIRLLPTSPGALAA